MWEKFEQLSHGPTAIAPPLTSPPPATSRARGLRSQQLPPSYLCLRARLKPRLSLQRRRHPDPGQSGRSATHSAIY
ncbi:hypothetical protein J5N97_003928 [Dioscorea zingiberensis]|uniref:Uncharacterized protein n=1 Tax=Dioscorea zingiberensis TaxID=325984 RepID=A0A9D5D713_9LILI|nr:hypothetical protein J5N97_003928 [Dioscorea zingiberensis]